MSTKLFRRLRAEITAADYTIGELAEEIGLSRAGFSLKINGKQPFSLWEAYKILGILRIPESRLPELFPPDGRYREEVA